MRSPCGGQRVASTGLCLLRHLRGDHVGPEAGRTHGHHFCGPVCPPRAALRSRQHASQSCSVWRVQAAALDVPREALDAFRPLIDKWLSFHAELHQAA